MDHAYLNDDRKARLRACKSTDELKALADEEGIELSDEQLEAVTGCGDPQSFIPDTPGQPCLDHLRLSGICHGFGQHAVFGSTRD